MPKPFKFRYVNEIVGSFVLVVVLLVVVSVILAGHAQDWFEPVHRLGLDFPPEGSLGLQKGADVEILGTTVGRVEKIRVNPEGNMSGNITIKGDFIRFVRVDSQALVKKKFGLAGDAYVEITQGTGEQLPEDARLTALKDTEILEKAQDILDQVRSATVPAMEKIQLAVEEYTKLAEDLRNPEGPLLKLLSNLQDITAGLQKGEGSAGQLLRDPTTAREIAEILKKVNESLDQVKVIVADVQRTTAQMPAMAEKVGGEVQNIPGLVVQTQETIREAERLIEGLQRHWLIRKYITQPQPVSTIPSSEVTP